MGEAVLFGAIGASALVLGSLVGGWVQVPKRVLAAMLSIGSMLPSAASSPTATR